MRPAYTRSSAATSRLDQGDGRWSKWAGRRSSCQPHEKLIGPFPGTSTSAHRARP
jgi:hypothetical protein